MQHIAAVIREILVHSKDIFDLKQHLPSLPDISTSPNFRHEFIEYASRLEWVTFHKNVVRREGGREREREGRRKGEREGEREGGREGKRYTTCACTMNGYKKQIGNINALIFILFFFLLIANS